MELAQGEKELIIAPLREYNDLFTWSEKDLKGINLAICHKPF